MRATQHSTARYRRTCYSFGYPACPNLEGTWKLLKPEEIGVHLTEGFMFHHPDCTYFFVWDTGQDNP